MRSPEKVIRIYDHPMFNLFQRSIIGTGIKSFLSTLSEQYYCAGQVGAIMLEEIDTESPEDIFGPPNGAIPYTETQIGFYDGFLDLRRLIPYKEESIELAMGSFGVSRKHTYGDCFFPHITSLFWQALPRVFAHHHGVVLYISPLAEPEIINARMKQLLAAPFPGETKWVQAVTSLYAVVIRVAGDGDGFHAWTQDQDRFDLLADALATEEAEIIKWLQTPDGQE